MKLLVFDFFFFSNSELVPIAIQTLGLSPLYDCKLIKYRLVIQLQFEVDGLHWISDLLLIQTPPSD
jgi:hypothetical protein